MFSGGEGLFVVFISQISSIEKGSIEIVRFSMQYNK